MSEFADRRKRIGIRFRMEKFRLSALLVGAAALSIIVTSGCTTSTATSTPATSATVSTTVASPVPSTKTSGNPDLLVETDWLEKNLADPTLRIVDARKADDYKKGHIKGAISIPVETTYATGGPQAAPETPEKIAQLLGSKGIGNDNRVIIYAEGKDWNASRLFWALEYYGHKKVSIVNGGIKKWQAEKKDISTADNTITAATFTAKINPVALATKDDVLADTSNPAAAIVDNRAPAEYSGAEPNAKRGGHVPKAVLIDWVNLFNADDTFKSTADLTKVYEEKGVTKDKKEVTTYCQVGLRSAVGYFTLRYLGYENPRHYIASWSEWGNDANAPVEK